MLSKKAQKDLASKFNAIQVAIIMQTKPDASAESIELWRRSERNATVYLLEQYGIELPCAKEFQIEQRYLTTQAS